MDCYEDTIVLMTSSPRMSQDSSEMHLKRVVETNDLPNLTGHIKNKHKNIIIINGASFSKP